MNARNGVRTWRRSAVPGRSASNHRRGASNRGRKRTLFSSICTASGTPPRTTEHLFVDRLLRFTGERAFGDDRRRVGVPGRAVTPRIDEQRSVATARRELQASSPTRPRDTLHAKRPTIENVPGHRDAQPRQSGEFRRCFQAWRSRSSLSMISRNWRDSGIRRDPRRERPLKATQCFRRPGFRLWVTTPVLRSTYLAMAPGVYSSRYAGEGATYADNVAKLLHVMKGVPPRRRGARFRCVLTFMAPTRAPTTVEGICQGVHPRGGAWRFRIWVRSAVSPRGEKRTFAELDPESKNTISHRGKALQAIRPVLMEYFAGISSN